MYKMRKKPSEIIRYEQPPELNFTVETPPASVNQTLAVEEFKKPLLFDPLAKTSRGPPHQETPPGPPINRETRQDSTSRSRKYHPYSKNTIQSAANNTQNLQNSNMAAHNIHMEQMARLSVAQNTGPHLSRQEGCICRQNQSLCCKYIQLLSNWKPALLNELSQFFSNSNRPYQHNNQGPTYNCNSRVPNFLCPPVSQIQPHNYTGNMAIYPHATGPCVPNMIHRNFPCRHAEMHPISSRNMCPNPMPITPQLAIDNTMIRQGQPVYLGYMLPNSMPTKSDEVDKTLTEPRQQPSSDHMFLRPTIPDVVDLTMAGQRQHLPSGPIFPNSMPTIPNAVDLTMTGQRQHLPSGHAFLNPMPTTVNTVDQTMTRQTQPQSSGVPVSLMNPMLTKCKAVDHTMTRQSQPLSSDNFFTNPMRTASNLVVQTMVVDKQSDNRRLFTATGIQQVINKHNITRCPDGTVHEVERIVYMYGQNTPSQVFVSQNNTVKQSDWIEEIVDSNQVKLTTGKLSTPLNRHVDKPIDNAELIAPMDNRNQDKTDTDDQQQACLAGNSTASPQVIGWQAGIQYDAITPPPNEKETSATKDTLSVPIPMSLIEETYQVDLDIDINGVLNSDDSEDPEKLVIDV